MKKEKFNKKDIDDYLNRLTQEQEKELLKYCNKYNVKPVICAWYEDKKDFVSDWCGSRITFVPVPNDIFDSISKQSGIDSTHELTNWAVPAKEFECWHAHHAISRCKRWMLLSVHLSKYCILRELFRQ